LICKNGDFAINNDGTVADCETRRELVQPELFSLQGTPPFDTDAVFKEGIYTGICTGICVVNIIFLDGELYII